MDEKEIKKSKNFQTISEFAKLVSKSEREIQNWIKDDKIASIKIKGRVYINAGQSFYMLYLALRDKMEHKKESKDITDLQKELLQANINNKNKDLKHKDIQIELKQIKKDIQEGKYIDTEKVKESNANFLQKMRNHTLSIPDRLLSMISSYIPKGKEREIQEKLKIDTSKIMQNFIDKLELDQKEKSKIMLNEKDEDKKKQGRKKK